MADGVEITAGSGTPIWTDEVGGKHYQVVKVQLGVDGSALGAQFLMGEHDDLRHV